MKFTDLKELDLFGGFVWLAHDGQQAVSMYYGKKVVWSYIIEEPKIQEKHMYTQLSYAMLAATYSGPEEDRVVRQIEILVQPEGMKPFLIPAMSYDVHHEIVEKFRTLYERTNGKHGTY